VVGFDRLGIEVLKKLVMNGQFAGSTFHAHVFDEDIDKKDGFFINRYNEMLDHYDIKFYPHGASSRELCSFIKEKSGILNYIVVALPDAAKGREATHDILELLDEVGRNMPVYQCCESTVVCSRPDMENVTYDLYDDDIIDSEDMDELAIRLNHFYSDPNGSAKEQWKKCDHFSRLSSRASADFLSSYLRRTGVIGKKELSEAQLENLGITEHLRWCAFHYTNGFDTMSREEWDERADSFKKEAEEKGSSRIKISKNMEKRRHACLIEWDELDELSDRENRVTGKNLDYKQMDKDNVLVISDLLAEE
jgi:hypothetical protein